MHISDLLMLMVLLENILEYRVGEKKINAHVIHIYI